MLSLLIQGTLGQGSWSVIGQSGVVCIHSFLLPNQKLVCVERPHEGIYPPNPFTGSTLSTEIDLSTTPVTYTPKPIQNNPFCAGHAQLGDGSILIAGGDNKTLDDAAVVNGRRGVRTYTPCVGTGCTGTWAILPDMTTERWYPTVLTLPKGNAMIIGGSTKNLDMDNLLATDNNPTYEYYPPKTGTWPRQLDILTWAFPHNLYPPSFVTPSGKVFMVVSNRTVLIDPETDAIENLNDMPVMDHSPWIYPHTPTAVVLPMTIANNWEFEVMMCGGTKLTSRGASEMCIAIKPDVEKSWRVVDVMPRGRVMPDCVILPDATVLFTNGQGNGTAGGNQGQTQYASQVVYDTDLFDPTKPSGQRWSSLAPAREKRLYHSGALLEEDASVITMGSEMNNYDDFWDGVSIGGIGNQGRRECFPNADRVCTDPFNYNIERFRPPYLGKPRPEIKKVEEKWTWESRYAVEVTGNVRRVTLVRMGTTTHSTNTDQRLVELVVDGRLAANGQETLFIRAPKNGGIAPPGRWFLFMLDNEGTPSVAKIVTIGQGAKVEAPMPAGTKPNGNGESRLGLGLAFVLGFLGFL